MPPLPFKNPYLGLPSADIIRTTIFVSRADLALLRSFDPKEGVFQITLSIMLTKLCHELRTATATKRLEQGDYAAYQHEICNATVGLGGGSTVVVPPAGTVASSPTEAPRSNVRRRASSVARKSAKSPKSDDATSASAGGRGDGGEEVGETKG